MTVLQLRTRLAGWEPRARWRWRGWVSTRGGLVWRVWRARADPAITNTSNSNPVIAANALSHTLSNCFVKQTLYIRTLD